MPRPPEHIPGVLAENRRHYELLVEMARNYAAKGDTERLLRAAQLAANYAWLAPIDLLSDLRLERLVVQALRGGGTVTVDGQRDERRLLHVLTEAYSIGGHTRLASRWMSRDDRTSDVVLTRQGGPVPAALVESVRTSGGELHCLQAEDGLVDRARTLRAHMDRADVVVLHVHPDDVVALAAANLPGVRPPVMHENHADLSFWLGVAGADLLCDWRVHSRPLDVDLRAVPEERVAVLPMPVEAVSSTSGDEVRRRLGIGPDAVVALTVADDWKVAASWGRGMHHLVDKVLHSVPRLSMVLVGVTPNDDWARLAKRYPGRVFSVGRVPDPGPFFDLADIYLESYPTRAGTTPLEAAAHGLPVVALAEVPPGDPARIFQTGSPGLDQHPAAASPEQFAVAVRRLALDPDRRRAGAEIRAAVLALHDGAGWRAGLEELYATARSLPAVDIEDLPAFSPADERYGALLLSALFPTTTSPDPRQRTRTLGPLFDETMWADLLAALFRHEASTLQVRVAPKWEDAPAWTGRLLALGADHRRLRISLPFVAGDDVRGTQSVARLTALLAQLGQTTETCGDLRLEVRPGQAALALNGVIGFSEEDLDRLEGVLSSQLWEPFAKDDADLAPVPEPAV